MKGVRVGPLDPDATENFGQVSGSSSARTLIRLHAQSYPGHLTRQLARPLDAERTKALDLDEVKGWLDGETLDNGDPVIPEGAVLEGASVRGERDREQILSLVYRVKGEDGPGTGRTGKWFVPYDREALPNSTERGDEAVRVHELKERGLVAFDDQGAHTQSLERENAQLRRRLEALESPRGQQPTAAQTQPQTLEEDPPVEGYDDLNADKVKKLLRDEGTSDETRRAVLDYERTHQNRSTVVSQAEQSLGLGDAS